MGRSVIVAKDGFVDFPLANILTRLGVSQSDLARRTGIKATYINRLVRGRSNPNWRTIMVIAAALQLNVGDFHED
jgi:transcriptional regulator with XRE-family HTH domain